LPPHSSEFYNHKENEASVWKNYEKKIRLLEDQVRQLKSDNETITVNYEEEIAEFEAVLKKLKDTLERLNNVQTSFSNLELKHIKTCSENKCLKDEHEDLKKELTQSKVMIKTLKKRKPKNPMQNNKRLLKRKMPKLKSFQDIR
jgi:chromosome segregation ATPase